MKDIKIIVPEGYEIDKKNSTFDLIKFKPITKALPKSWEELKTISGYYSDLDCNIRLIKLTVPSLANKNVFRTKEQANASNVLAQLSQLRDEYRQGWVPNWNDLKNKWCIVKEENTIVISDFMSTNFFLSFQSKEIAKEFLKCFRDLIEEASPLLF